MNWRTVSRISFWWSLRAKSIRDKSVTQGPTGYCQGTVCDLRAGVGDGVMLMAGRAEVRPYIRKKLAESRPGGFQYRSFDLLCAQRGNSRLTTLCVKFNQP